MKGIMDILLHERYHDYGLSNGSYLFLSTEFNSQELKIHSICTIFVCISILDGPIGMRRELPFIIL